MISLVHACGTELSWSAKQEMGSKRVIWLLQPIVFS